MRLNTWRSPVSINANVNISVDAGRMLMKHSRPRNERLLYSFVFCVVDKLRSYLLVMLRQDVDEREGDIKLMKEELQEAQEREKEADVVLKVTRMSDGALDVAMDMGVGS